MDHAPLVRRAQARQDAVRDLERATRRERPARPDRVLQVVAVDELEDEERQPADLSEVQQRDDVGVLERGADARFLERAADRVRVVASQQLDGDLAAELAVLGQ
jgi:hypothetical protein